MTRDNLPALAIGCILVLVYMAAPAFACGDGSCNPPPPPPVTIIVTPDPPDRSDPVTTPTPEYMPCCQRDGMVIWKAPFNINKARAKMFCTAQAISNIDAIPACKKWRVK